MEDLFCKVYVNSELDRDGLLKRVASVVGGEVFLRTVNAGIFDVSVFNNDDYDRSKSELEGGFVFYPFYFEIEPLDEESVDVKDYKRKIKSLLDSFRVEGVKVTASCDFEDDLVDG